MKNLISMTDFVLEQELQLRNDSDYSNGQCLVKCFDYANFLKQANEKWMFVPCDEQGNVLEHPNFIQGKRTAQFYNDKMNLYQQAKERCLFENVFFIRNCGVHGISIETLKHDYIFNSNGKNTNLIIEDLVKYNLILTPTALKQLGL